MENKFDNLLYKLVRYGLMLAVFVPLIIFRNNFSVFNFGKVVVFRTLIELLIIAYIPLAIKYPKFRPPNPLSKKNRILFVLTLFTISYVVSTFLGVNWFKSFWGEWERMGGLFSWLHYYSFFVIAISVFREKKEWLDLLWLSVLAALVSTFYGFFQRGDSIYIVGASEGRTRIFGTLGNPASFASYILFNLYFAFYLFSKTLDKREKGFLLFSSFVFIVAILMSGVRGAFLALIISGLWLLGVTFWKKRKKFIPLLVLAVIIVAGFFFVRSDIIQNSPILGRLANYSLEDETIKNRLIVWGIALDGVVDRPLFGWGPENFESVFSLHYDPAIYKGVGTNVFDRAHNIFLDIGVAQGLVGLFLFLFLWYTAIKKTSNRFLISLILAYFISNFFFFDLSSQYILLMVLFGLVSYDSENRESNKSCQKNLKILPALIILLSPLIYYANIRPVLANQNSVCGFVSFSEAGRSGNQEEYEKGVQCFRQAVDLSGWSRSDVLRKFSESHTKTIIALGGKIPEDDLENDTRFLVEKLKEDRERKSREFTSYVYEYKTMRLLGLYVDPAIFGEVKKRQEEAIEKFPNVVELYLDVADSDFFLEDHEHLIRSLEKAHELNSEVLETKFELGKAYVLFDPEKEDRGMDLIFKTISEGYGNREDINWLGEYLEKRKDYEKMVEVFSILAEIRPVYNIQLSYSYLLMGDKERAKEKADQAFRLPLTPQQNQLILEIYEKLR
jgi:O-antigen ligase